MAKGIESPQKDSADLPHENHYFFKEPLPSVHRQSVIGPLTALSEIRHAFGAKREDTSQICIAEHLPTTETYHLVDSTYEAYTLFNIRDQMTEPLCVAVFLNDHPG